MNPSLAAVACVILAAGLTSCTPTQPTPLTEQGQGQELGQWQGRFPTPETDLPEATADLQKLVDQTPDSQTATIPLGLYVLTKPLRISQRNNLHLAFAPGTQLRCTDTEQAVIAIQGCGAITITGVRARHVKPLTEYNCHGPVVSIDDSKPVRIENCELNGCGAIGVSARRSTIAITNCYIHHNTFNAFYFDSCKEVTVVGNIIENNTNTFQSYRCEGMTFSDNLVQNNGGYWQPARQPGLLPETQPAKDSQAKK